MTAGVRHHTLLGILVFMSMEENQDLQELKSVIRWVPLTSKPKALSLEFSEQPCNNTSKKSHTWYPGES